MVVTKNLKVEGDLSPINRELRLGSGRAIRYVAPLKLNVCTQPSASDVDQYIVPPRKRSSSDTEQTDDWDGVVELCQAIDDAMEIDNDTELLADKRVLEMGFCTGLPSIFALDSGATDVALHCWSSAALELYVKPTLQRNNVRRNRYKLSSGDLSSCKRAIGGQKFDIILAPELINADESEFDALHDILDHALADNGIVLVKLRACFDAHVRWVSPKPDLAPRKVVQLTRIIR
ncbi:Protein F22B7.9 [Aphelenchoides avenae]|nr:Protein F22B7.9 [Aphelenchus avenae]